MLRGKTGKTFFVQFARPNGAIWCNNILYNFLELFWSVRVDRKKSHYNSRVSLHEAPTKKVTGGSLGHAVISIIDHMVVFTNLRPCSGAVLYNVAIVNGIL